MYLGSMLVSFHGYDVDAFRWSLRHLYGKRLLCTHLLYPLVLLSEKPRQLTYKWASSSPCGNHQLKERLQRVSISKQENLIKGHQHTDSDWTYQGNPRNRSVMLTSDFSSSCYLRYWGLLLRKMVITLRSAGSAWNPRQLICSLGYWESCNYICRS